MAEPPNKALQTDDLPRRPPLNAGVMHDTSMNEPATRMTQSLNPPSDIEVREWIGKKAHEYWKQVTHIIERDYPGVFSPEWLFGGKSTVGRLDIRNASRFVPLFPKRIVLHCSLFLVRKNGKKSRLFGITCHRAFKKNMTRQQHIMMENGFC